MQKSDFSESRAAIEKMREMSLRATPSESEKNSKENRKTYKSGLNIPFLDSIFSDSDATLIIALLLLLLSENTDKILLFALVYILL